CARVGGENRSGAIFPGRRAANCKSDSLRKPPDASGYETQSISLPTVQYRLAASPQRARSQSPLFEGDSGATDDYPLMLSTRSLRLAAKLRISLHLLR